jgi:hypothetical protein
MHNAPAVSFPVGRSHFQGAFVGALVACAALAESAWSLSLDAVDWRQALAAALWLTTSVILGWSWWQTPTGTLSWDGLTWHWAVGEQSMVIVPMLVLDLQSAVWLRLHATGDGVDEWTWVWLDLASNTSRWMALRRAIFSRVKSADDALADFPNSPQGFVGRVR